ncbi:hypothetical protein CTAYLR_002104 [Chrysophaeum taylorii]|uniref:SUN domain-containing protein n=1 Tax=Chrysophaeum taylorii TaxID=2483200 RepID=A0AAD7XPV3_9STRA|nr:hypothetical protein CTAYLR_002104 [Chrysophaeum taylorii]
MLWLLLAVASGDDRNNETSNATTNGTKKAVKLINYASMESGAVVLETSELSKGFQNLLLDDKDKYGLTPCAEEKMLTIGLSEDIQAKEVVLAQYEKYSSGVRTFEVFGSRIFPTSEWQSLGTFEAAYGEGEQSFEILPTWVRYLKFHFLSHHGNEYACTLSQIKVHGTTLLQPKLEEQQQEPPPEPPHLDCSNLDFRDFKQKFRNINLESSNSIMDKLRGLERNQSIVDFYLANLHACLATTTTTTEERNTILTVQDMITVQDALIAAAVAFLLCFLTSLAALCAVCCTFHHTTHHYYHDASTKFHLRPRPRRREDPSPDDH